MLCRRPGGFLICPFTNAALAYPEAFQKPSPHTRQDSFGSYHGFPDAGTIQIHSVASDPDGWLDEFAVIDKRTVITGSFNWSPSAAHQNDEVLLVIESPLLAAHFTREMDRLWKGAELGITDRLARKLQQGRMRCGSGIARG